jgi:hypothetical protein
MSDTTRLEAIKSLFEYIKYPTEEKKQNAIKSLANSNMSIQDIKMFTDQVREFQGLNHSHYS